MVGWTNFGELQEERESREHEQELGLKFLVKLEDFHFWL